MYKVLLLLHTEPDGSLEKVALEALSAAQAIGGRLVIGLVGADVQAAADRLAGAEAESFLAVAGELFRHSRYATDAASLEAICRAAGADCIIAPATSRWCRVIPGVAQRLGGRVETHVNRVFLSDGVPTVTRWYYRQRIEGTLSCTIRPWLILLDPGTYPAWSGVPGSVTVESIPVVLPDSFLRTQVAGIRAPAPDAQTIRPDADLLFVAGAGWTKKQQDGLAHTEEAERLILEFLSQAKASLGGSKSLVDLSGEGQAVLRCMTHLNQVGQTGSTPRHPKGLSTCCHGEEPHVVGWRFVSERRAVNLDPNCGWARGKADVLYVADAFEVLRQLNALLKARQAATPAAIA